MKRLIGTLLFAAAMLCARGADATAYTGLQTTNSAYVAMVQGDTLCSATPGASYSTALFNLYVGSATGVVVTWGVSKNYNASLLAQGVYATQASSVSANPAVAATATTTGLYEFELGSNITHSCATITTATGTIYMQQLAGRSYAPGSVITTTLYDITGATAATVSATLDVSGWRNINISLIPVSGTTFTSAAVQGLDDTGAAAFNQYFAGGLTATVSFGIGVGLTQTQTDANFQPHYGMALMKRILLSVAAGASSVARVRVEGER